MNIHLGGAQIACLAVTLFSGLIYAKDHGKPRTGTDNIWYWVVATAINYSILIWGGFFK
jgi:hypothetical protein